MRGITKERRPEHADFGAFSNQCRGKIKYTTIKSAEGALRVMRNAHKNSRLRRYRCSHCHQWHLGNSR